MFVSTETIAIVISAATLLLGFASAFGWMIHRMDGMFATQRDELRAEIRQSYLALDAKIDGTAAALVAKIDGKATALGARIDGLADRVGNLETTTAALGSRIDGLADRVGKVETEIGGMRGDLVEVKISVARLEGPPRHLVTSR
ncbi:hypothetical protein [Microbacterium sp.]|uniref:hypothetical protein n=1 Tax=Microbacterium sp. TaxID=51671 RepID=UPI0028966D98|nr:hypothetical protein [Microbacterium sp.]